PRNSKIAKDNYDFNNRQYINSHINIKTLENERYILLRENFRLGKISRQIFKYHNIYPKDIIEVSYMNTAISMSSVGLGLTFMPESGIEIQALENNDSLYFSIGEPCFN